MHYDGSKQQHNERMVAQMSAPLFEWDRFVGRHMTPVDAVHRAREAGQTFEAFARSYAAEHPVEDLSTDELADGMLGDMHRAAHNLATFRVTGSPTLAPYSEVLFAEEPEDPDDYYGWIETADENEIVAQVTARESGQPG